MQFLVIARDGTDPEAPARRQAVREAHLEVARQRAAEDSLHIGGALLGADGGMLGSAMVFEAENEEALWALLHADIYHQGGVWQSYEVFPFRRAV